MRKKYPGLYMVLVIDSLSKEEAPEYLKAGINNTIKYESGILAGSVNLPET